VVSPDNQRPAHELSDPRLVTGLYREALSHTDFQTDGMRSHRVEWFADDERMLYWPLTLADSSAS
jgi:hypothetical protein